MHVRVCFNVDMQTLSPILPSLLHVPAYTLAAPGCLRRLWDEASRFGKTGLLVHGQSLVKSGRLANLLAHTPNGLRVVPHCHGGGEPTLAQLDAIRSTAHAARVDWVAAVGGGSVLDLGKACAGLVHAPAPSAAYHDGAPVPAEGCAPFLAVPTTAGTGSEATSVCVLINDATGVKKSFRSPALMARAVLLDPELLEDAPRSVIAASGMDAFTQALESYVSKHATPFTRQLSLTALERIGRSLVSTYEGRRTGCTDLLQGSFLAGIALAHARLGLVHGLAHPLGARYHVGHGAACAACLPAVLRFNAEACAADFERVGAVLGQPIEAFVAQALTKMRLENPFAGPVPDDIDDILAEVLASGSTTANPRPVSAGDARHVLDAVLGGFRVDVTAPDHVQSSPS
jgi:alcohol dehydrogenase class IV